MTTIVQVEYRPSLLSAREDILQLLGHPVVSVLGSRVARNLDLSNALVGVVVIGHMWVRMVSQALAGIA